MVQVRSVTVIICPTRRIDGAGNPNIQRILPYLHTSDRQWSLINPSKTNSSYESQSQRRLVTPIVICTLLGAIGFNLWRLFPETTGGGIPSNDTLFHLRLIDSAVDAISHGKDITDPWLGTASLGFPVFHHYQHLPHVLVALTHIITFKVFPLIDMIRWTTYLLLSLFPLSMYWSLRRFSFDPLTCAMGGLLASLIGIDLQFSSHGMWWPAWGGFDYANYTFTGYGLYTQLWGMVLLPLALAFGYQTIKTGQGYFWATVLLSATLMSHLITGYMAFLTIGVLTFIPDTKTSHINPFLLGIWIHWRRLIVLFILVLSVTMYFTVPFILDHEYFGVTAANTNLTSLNSFGHQVVLEALVKGNLFDLNRFPSFTILVFAGVASCICYRNKTRYLIPLVIFLLWLLLFFGRPTWGPVIGLLPLSQDIHMHRFIQGVHLGGAFLSATALAILWRWAVSRSNLAYLVGALILTLLILSPVYVERQSYLSLNAREIEENQKALKAEQNDIDSIIETLNGLPAGRVYAGLLQDPETGSGYRIGSTPVAHILGESGIDMFYAALHQYSLVSTVLSSFDQNLLEQYELFNIKYVVVPEELHMPNFMKPIEKFGRHQLYQVQTTGYFDLVGSQLTFTGTKAANVSIIQTWLESGLLEAKRHPQMSINGSPPFLNDKNRPSTIILNTPLPSDPSLESLDDLSSYISQISTGPSRGSIISEGQGLNSYSATVDVERESMMMLKVSYHPNWRVTVDGSKADTLMLMPGFIGVQLGPGEHNVFMEYKSRDLRKVLLSCGLVTLLLIGLWEKRRTSSSTWMKLRVPTGIPFIMKGTGANRSSRRRRSRRNR